MNTSRALVPVLIGSLSIGTPAASTSARTAASTPSSINIDLRPGAPDGGALRSLEVSVSIAASSVSAGARIAVLPVMTDALTTSAADIEGFSVSDANGRVPTRTQDVTRDPANIDRYWIVDRATVGRVTWRYRVTVDPAKPLLSLPMYELRSSFGALSGAGSAFLALPADKAKRRVSLRWNLKALPAGAVGLSSFGSGDTASAGTLTTEDLSSTYYMVGSAGRYAARDGGFFAGWQGAPAFDMTALMSWAAGLHAYYGEFFRDPKPVFGIFGRSNPDNPGSGIGLTNSFAFTFGNTTTAADLRVMLGHEMLHVWVSSLDAVADADPLLDSWFSEGLAVYYQRVLPYRAGAISADDYLADLNQTLVRYYTDSMSATPNDRIPALFWKDARVRVLPYDRGSLYFAQLNAQIARVSGGRRSLDDLVLALLAERRAGRPMTVGTWTAFLRKELGGAGVRDWRAMMVGQRIELTANSFGPCFVKTTMALGEFDMGYDFVTSNANGRIVQGLKAGSNAALAGLRNGDVVKKGGAGDSVQGKPEAMVTLQIERGGQPLTIRYSARGSRSLVPQWRKSPGTDDRCSVSADLSQGKSVRRSMPIAG